MLTAIALFQCTAVLSCIFLFFRLKNKKRLNLPPGPRSLPIFGNLLELGPDYFQVLGKLSKTYGPIMRVYFGPQSTVCLHGAQLLKEAFNDPNFSGRIVREAFNLLGGDEKGIIASEGHHWSEQRRFMLRTLREFGFGKSTMEELILNEVTDLIEFLHRSNAQPVVLQERFSLAVFNALWKLLTGQRFDHDDAKLHGMLEDMKTVANIFVNFEHGKNLLVFFYPRIAKMFPKFSGWAVMEEKAAEKNKMIDAIIADHIQTYQEDEPRDFIDVYLSEIYKTTDPNSGFYRGTDGLRSLRAVMADLFVGGTDTTAVSLTWFILHLLHNPKVQKKVQAELDRVITPGQQVRLGDRRCLPYTEAVILESMRLASIAPIPIPHSTKEDVVFHGYDIPKGTMIIANTWALHHDPEVWGEDVEDFKPERFLNFDASCVLKHDCLIPFSLGKRVCPADTLAKDSLFLFGANMVLNFAVESVPGKGMPPLEWKKGQLTLLPVSSEVVMRPRT